MLHVPTAHWDRVELGVVDRPANCSRNLLAALAAKADVALAVANCDVRLRVFEQACAW